jgi:outer membrane lipoprotein SlyB
MQRITLISLFSTLLFVSFSSDVFAQRSGQSTTIRTGSVTGVQNVDLMDGNVAGGAVVGGALASAFTSSSRSRSTRNRNAAIGALIGGATAANKRTTGRNYTVTTNDGTIIQVLTEQTEIALGDCVFIEERRNGTNIRRAPGSACEPESRQLLQDKDVSAVLQQDAESCFAARQELAEAEDDAAFDLAVRKVKLLCYD